MRNLKQLLFTLFLSGLAIVPANAQGAAQGTVTGKVVNSKGAAVSKALVIVTSDVAPSFKAKATCNTRGEFSVPNVPGGPIMVSAVKSTGAIRASANAAIASDGSSVAVEIKIPAGQ